MKKSIFLIAILLSASCFASEPQTRFCSNKMPVSTEDQTKKMQELIATYTALMANYNGNIEKASKAMQEAQKNGAMNMGCSAENFRWPVVEPIATQAPSEKMKKLVKLSGNAG